MSWGNNIFLQLNIF